MSVTPPKLSIGPVETVFLERLITILNAAKLQTSYNIERLLEEKFNEIAAQVISEQFTLLVNLISSAGSENDFSFKGYTYPSLDTSYIVDKQDRFGFTDHAPFKQERFAQNYQASLVGIMENLAKHRDSGTQILRAFGQYYPNSYREWNDNFTSLIKDPSQRKHFETKAQEFRKKYASRGKTK